MPGPAKSESNWKPAAITSAAVIGLFAALYVGSLRYVTLSWQPAPGATVTIVEKSVDLTNWTQVARVKTNTIRLPADGPQGFFRVAHPVMWTTNGKYAWWQYVHE